MPHYPERLIPIVAFAAERFEAFPDVPTHVELGIGTDGDGRYAELLSLENGLHQMRGIIGPPDMPAEAVAWYADLFQKVWETPEWQEFIANNAMSPIFMGPDEYKKWLIAFEDNHASLMSEDERGLRLGASPGSPAPLAPTTMHVPRPVSRAGLGHIAARRVAIRHQQDREKPRGVRSHA
jgi:hypothetical protein